MASTNLIHSDATYIANLDLISYALSWTGTPTGTITIDGSVDGSTFFDLTFDPVLAQPSGAAGGYLVNVSVEGFGWIRVSYTNASGTGTLTVKISGKDSN